MWNHLVILSEEEDSGKENSGTAPDNKKKIDLAVANLNLNINLLKHCTT